MIFNLHNLNVSREELFSWIKGFNKFFKVFKDVTPYKHNIKNHVRHKKIRVGYISPDIRFHVVTFFTMHFFKSYDKTRFEVYAYANNEPDEVTREFDAEIDVLRIILNKSAKEVAAQIFDDEIDILVELAGHSSNNRLDVMAYKPAPIQMSGVGWFNSTSRTSTPTPKG